MGELKDLTAQEFAAQTGSSAPVPGGGSVSALTGALAAALAARVANLTAGKEKYASVDAEMRELAQSAARIREELIGGIKKDSESFGGYMRALKLPKETEEEKAARREALQQGLKEATQAPLAIARTAAEIFPLAQAAVERGNSGAVSDGLISAMLARTAVLGALLNVKINLNSIRDEVFAGELKREVERLEQAAAEGEARILAMSELSASFVK